MLCSYCSTPNPDTNRFCGECGQPLVRQQVSVPAEFGSAPANHSHRAETTISGPSFLGLTDSADDHSDYLLEDDQPHQSHTGWVVFSAVALILLGVVGWLEWNAIKTGQIELPWVKSSSAAPAPAPEQQAENASATPATTENAINPDEQKPQAEGGNNADSTTPSDSQPMLAAADKPKETDTTSSDSESDTKATNDAQARMAKDAADLRDKAGDKAEGADSSASPSDKTPDKKTKAAGNDEKAAPKAKPVKAAAPDPRQDRMLVAGEKYLYGRGVPQNCNQALIYFRAAAEKENGPAMSHLGAMYASGHCVTQNKVAAYKWFSRASNSDPNNQWISRNLNMIWREMSPQERASVAR